MPNLFNFLDDIFNVSLPIIVMAYTVALYNKRRNAVDILNRMKYHTMTIKSYHMCVIL